MLLNIDSLTMRFGGLVALDDISVSVQEKTIHGIVGPNGSGKTTLFNVVNGIYKPTSGRIMFKGEDITAQEPHVVAKKGIARTFQLLRIFPSLTVIENLMMGLTTKDTTNESQCVLFSPKSRAQEREFTDKAFEILKVIGLEKKAYNSAEALSIGQRRMLQLGQGIISDPDLLMLDEPAAGLDPINIDRLIDMIIMFKEQRGITVLLVEHIMNVVMRVCEELTVLDYGEKIFVGKPADAAQDPKVIEAYLGSED